MLFQDFWLYPPEEKKLCFHGIYIWEQIWEQQYKSLMQSINVYWWPAQAW